MTETFERRSGGFLADPAAPWALDGTDQAQAESDPSRVQAHRTKQPLTVWFWAAHLMATHSNGMSALQLKDQLGLSYKTAWLLVQKLRRAMVDPEREKLEGLVEIDQTELPYRTGDAFFDPKKAGNIIVIGAVEVVDYGTGGPPAIRLGKKYLDTRSGRIRLAAIPATTTSTSENSFSPTSRWARAC